MGLIQLLVDAFETWFIQSLGNAMFDVSFHSSEPPPSLPTNKFQGGTVKGVGSYSAKFLLKNDGL